MMKNNENGRSMIEMLGVLAIVGVLSVGGIAGYSKAMGKFKANKVIDQVTTISTNIRTMYASQRNYSGFSIKTALEMGLIPSEMYASASSYTDSSVITHAFGGNAIVLAADVGTVSDDNAFIIGLTDVPKTACIAIATTDWGGDSASGLVAMAIDPKNTDVTAGTTVAATSLNTDTITASSAAASDSVNIAVPGDDAMGIPFSLTNATTLCSDSNAISWKYQ